VPSALLPIFLIIVVDILGMTIMYPLLPFYAEHHGAGPLGAGLLVSVYAVCQLFGGPLLGRLSDRTGRKPLLLLSQIGTLFGFVLLALADSLWLIFVSRVIDGITAGNISLAQAYIADVTKPEERTKSFAVIGIAFGLGFLIGPAVSGYLAQFSYLYPIYAAIALSATSIVATAVLLPATKPAASTDRRLSIFGWGAYAGYFRQPGLSGLLWQFLAYMFCFALFMSGFPLFAERRFTWNGHPFGPKEVGYMYAYVGVLGIILQGGLVGRMSKTFGDWKLVRGGLFLAVVGFIALGWTFGITGLLIVTAAIACGTGVVRPALTSLITQFTDRAEQGSVLGLTQALQSVASIIAPFLAGLMIQHGQLHLWAVAAALSAGLALMASKPIPQSSSVEKEEIRL
jgi:MFS transporter, DHA1 family, tetracycline resistance protein